MIIARAPVRITFGNDGADRQKYYATHGSVLFSAAITRYCYVMAGEAPDGGIRINSSDQRVWQTFPREAQIPLAEPLALPKATLQFFLNEGLQSRGVDLFLASEARPETGLGSSSAMAVALVRALAAHLGLQMDTALLLKRACELTRLGMPVQQQDLYATAYGGLNIIEFSADGVVLRPLPVSAAILEALDARLLLFATPQDRRSAPRLQGQRASSGAKRPVVEQMSRMQTLTERMSEALLTERLDDFGALLDLGWHEQLRLLGSTSATQTGIWYDAAREAGALGGKLTSASPGGFLLLYCPLASQPAVRRMMAEFGLCELPFEFDRIGAQLVAPIPTPDPRAIIPPDRGLKARELGGE
jgi:D-glycero-alpha-D-manno-heptose-7-phosphate kinase